MSERAVKRIAVVAGDGTIQLPPEVLGQFPPGTLFTVDHLDGSVTLVAGGAAVRDIHSMRATITAKPTVIIRALPAPKMVRLT